MKYRTVGVFLFIGAMLLILAAINVRIISSSMVTPAKVETTLHDIFGTEFTAGEITFNFWRGIKVSDITLPLDNYDFIRVKTLRVTYDQTKLLRRKFVIDKVVLYNPEIYIVNNRFPEFRLNQTGSMPAPAIIIRNGTLVFSGNRFLKDGAAVRLKNINLNLYPITKGRYMAEGGFDAAELGNWRIGGELDMDAANVNINLLSQNTDIGSYLGGILSGEYLHIWQRYQPGGRVNLNIRLSIGNGNGQSPEVTVLMDCLKNDMTFDDFPYPLSKIEGQVEFTVKGASLRNLKGVNGLTAVTANGLVEGYEQSGGLDLALKIQNMAFDDKLHNALKTQRLMNVWSELSPGGLADAEVNINKPIGVHQETRYQTRIYCKKVQAKPSFFPYPLEGLSGEIEITDRLIKLKALSAVRNTGEVTIDGEMSIDQNGQAEVMAVNIEAKNIETSDYILKEATDKIVAGIGLLWDKPQPEGLVNVSVALRKPDAKSSINARTVVQCNGMAAKIGPSALPFTNIQGQIEYHTSFGDAQQPYLAVKNLSAEFDQSRFELSGGISNPVLGPAASRARPEITLDVKITNLRVGGAALYSLFPSNIKYLLEQINFSAHSDITLKITNEGRETVNYQGEIKLFDCGFTRGLDFSNITGSIIFKGLHSTKASHLAGSGKFSQLKVQGKVINNMSVTFMQEGNHISFYDIKGNLYNGAINGHLVVILPSLGGVTGTDTAEYQGKIEIGSVDMKDFARDTAWGSKDTTSKLSGEFTFNGTGMSIETMNGTGRATLTDAQIWEVPVFLSIYDLFGLAKKNVFNEGTIRFSTANGEMLIRKLSFTSKDVILKSAGKMKLKDGSLDLQFDTQFLDTKILIFDKLKNWIFGQIYTVKVVGTFDKPKAEIKVLPILSE
ncbi:MAG: hypothetical protein AB1599_05305 [Planctomycetota bacterium]